MNTNIDPNGDFIEEWIKKRRVEMSVDIQILDIIDECRLGIVLQEEELLKRLIKHSDSQDSDDETD